MLRGFFELPERLTAWERLAHLLAAILVASAMHHVWQHYSIRDRPLGHMRIEVRQTAPAGGYLRVQAVLADGNLVRWDPATVTQMAGWKPREVLSVLPVFLDYDPDGGPQGVSSFEFDARNAVVVLESRGWTGTVRVLRDGRPTQKPRQIAAAGGELFWTTLSDWPGLPDSRKAWLLAFLGWVAVALGFGVLWPPGFRRLEISLAVSALWYHFLYWLSVPVGYQGDSVQYLRNVALLAEGVSGAYPPGYSVLLGVLGWVCPQDRIVFVAALLQHILAVVCVLLLFRLVRRFVDPMLAWLASMAVAFSMPVVATAQSLLTEIPTFFAMIGALYWSVLAVEEGQDRARQYRLAVWAGVLGGFAGLLRVVPMAGVVPAMAMILLWGGDAVGATQWRRRWVLTAAALAGVAVTFSMPMLWYGLHGNPMKIATSSGFHLLNRVAQEQKLLREDGPATRRLQALMPGRDFRTSWNWEIIADPRVRGMDIHTLEKMVGSAALEAIASNPGAYLLYSLRLAWRIYFSPTGAIPIWPEATTHAGVVEQPPILPLTARTLHWRWDLDRWSGHAWQVAALLAVAGALVLLRSPRALTERRNLIPAAMAVTVLMPLLATASLSVFSSRYNAPVVPLACGLAMLPIDRVWRLLRRLAWPSRRSHGRLS